jgi:hypothetical protein
VAIIGQRPETGVRIAIERPRTSGPPWSYTGEAVSPEASYPLVVAVSEAGEVGVTIGPSAEGQEPPGDLAEKVRLIVRTAYRQASGDGDAPAWRIVRWRARD